MTYGYLGYVGQITQVYRKMKFYFWNQIEKNFNIKFLSRSEKWSNALLLFQSGLEEFGIEFSSLKSSTDQPN